MNNHTVYDYLTIKTCPDTIVGEDLERFNEADLSRANIQKSIIGDSVKIEAVSQLEMGQEMGFENCCGNCMIAAKRACVDIYKCIIME